MPDESKSLPTSSGAVDDQVIDGVLVDDSSRGINPPDEHLKPSQKPPPPSLEVFQALYHQGPLPHPAMMAAYAQVLPGSAERILQMAEKQQAHRMGLETTVIAGDTKRADTGQWIGAGLTVFGFLVAAFVGLMGQPVLGGILGGGTLASIVSVFVIGKVKNERERDKKAKMMTGDRDALPTAATPKPEPTAPMQGSRSRKRKK